MGLAFESRCQNYRGHLLRNECIVIDRSAFLREACQKAHTMSLKKRTRRCCLPKTELQRCVALKAKGERTDHIMNSVWGTKNETLCRKGCRRETLSSEIHRQGSYWRLKMTILNTPLRSRGTGSGKKVVWSSKPRSCGLSEVVYAGDALEEDVHISSRSRQ